MIWFIILSVAIVTFFLFWWRHNVNSDLFGGAKAAPDFELPDQYGNMHKLQDYFGKWLVLYFYPKDNTPGCTKQACGFRDMLNELAKMNVAVLGVSLDDTDSHADFASKYHLQFPLLVDQQGEIAARYHSLINLGLIKFARRNTFLINPQGKIAKVFFSASAKRNAYEVFTDIKKLQAMNPAVS